MGVPNLRWGTGALTSRDSLIETVRASLPLGRGVVLDPFMGGGSTIAAAEAVGYKSVGVELDPVFFRVAEQAIPKLAALVMGERATNGGQSTLSVTAGPDAGPRAKSRGLHRAPRNGTG